MKIDSIWKQTVDPNYQRGFRPLTAFRLSQALERVGTETEIAAGKHRTARVIKPLAVRWDSRDEYRVAAIGFEHSTDSFGNLELSTQGGAESGALVTIELDLASLIDAWPTLPEPIKAGILTMVKVASEILEIPSPSPRKTSVPDGL